MACSLLRPPNTTATRTLSRLMTSETRRAGPAIPIGATLDQGIVPT